MTNASTVEVLIVDLLADLGFETDDARGRARTVIENARLTNAQKRRIAHAKLPSVAALLRGTFAVVCTRTACRNAARRSDRELIDAARPTACEVCNGSTNQSEIDRAVEGCLGAGYRRIVVVGGSPGTHKELDALVGGRLEVRLVSGTERRTGRAARSDLEWADVVVVWGSTELDHQVSKLYTDKKAANVITCPRRGIAALALTVSEHLRRRRGP